MYHEINDNGFHLYEIPNEILLDIMIHLDEISLLDMSQVCSRFRAVAKEAFAKKFTGRTSTDYFEIKAFCEYRTEEYIRYRPFFYVFGENMCAIDIRLFDDAPVARNHWLIELIQRYCASLSKLTIFGGSQLDLVGIIGPRQKSTLTHIRLYGVKLLDNSWANQNYPRLIGFDAHYSIEQNVLDSFLSNNRQIEELDFSYCRFQFDVFLLLNGRMNALKTLQIHDYTPMAGDRYNLIQLESLESVELCIDPDTTLNLLRGISEGCKNLKHLYLKENSHHHLSWDDISIQAICNLTNLHSITICAGSLGIFRLSRIVSSLPKLKYLDLKHYYEETEINQNITAIIKCCINLHKLDIEVCSDPPELNRDFMKKMAKITLKSAHLDVTLDRNLKLMSRDGEVWNDDGIIYWDGYHPKFNKSKLNLLNLNDECLGKIAGYLDLYCRCNFYDTCKRTRNAVAEYTSKNKFNASLNMEDRIFQTLGKHIRSMSIDITVVNANNDDNSDDEVIASWSRVNRFCPKIKEMTVTSIFYVLDDIRQIPNLRWPKMKQLIFATPYPVSCRVLRSFECPKLEYLEVRSFAGEFECFFGANCVKWSFHEAFENLKTLKVNFSIHFVDHILISFCFSFLISLAVIMKMFGNS